MESKSADSRVVVTASSVTLAAATLTSGTSSVTPAWVTVAVGTLFSVGICTLGCPATNYSSKIIKIAKFTHAIYLKIFEIWLTIFDKVKVITHLNLKIVSLFSWKRFIARLRYPQLFSVTQKKSVYEIRQIHWFGKLYSKYLNFLIPHQNFMKSWVCSPNHKECTFYNSQYT